MGKLNPDKTRIMVSVKKTTVDEFRNAAKSLGLSRNVLSEVVDDALIKTTKIFRLAEEKGKTFSVVDLFHMIGEEIESAQQEEKDTCPKCGRPMHTYHDCVLNPVANPEGVNDAKPAQKTTGVAKVPRR